MSRRVTTEQGETVSNDLRVDEGVQPTISLLLGIFVAHVVIWIGLVRLVPGGDGVDYPDLGTLGTPWVRQFVIPLLVVLAFQVVVITRLGWWKSVLREPSRTTRRWLVVFPVVVFVLGLTRFLSDGFAGDAGASYLIGCIVTMTLVGLTEEITFRGIQQVGARRVFTREWQAVVFASVLFGLFHTPNIVIGAEVGDALRQTVFTAIIGTAFYCLRRVSGSLIPCIVLHAVYDFLLIQGAWDTLL
jgi:membrane protease YdiL (CAAX protease family)